MNRRERRQRQRQEQAHIADQKTSFGLCLSALTVLHGKEIEPGVFEHILHTEDFDRISESYINLETGIFDERPGCKIIVSLKDKTGGAKLAAVEERAEASSVEKT